MSFVKSIERAFEVLGAVANRPAGISDLARTVGLPTSTTARLLKTLERIDVVDRDDAGIYSLGPVALGLASRAKLPAQVRAIDHARLVALSVQIGEIVGLSVQSGPDVLYVDQADSPNEVQVRDWSGERVPLHVVSSGLVFLAHSRLEFLEEYLSGPLDRFTDRTECDPERLLARLEAVRRAGHAWTIDEFHRGITSVAVPLNGRDGSLVGALHSHGPTYRFPGPGTAESTAARLMHVATQLSHAMGWLDETTASRSRPA